MRLKQFLKSKTFFRQILYAAGITLLLLILAMFALRIYTRHGEAFPVPDVLGMSEEEFKEVFHDFHLYYRIIDSTYNPEMKPGGVVDQIPDAGHKVKRHRLIYLTINTKTPEKVYIPKLTDISYRQAIVQLEFAGLLPGKITYEPSEFQNLVLKAKIGGMEAFEGEMVARGTIVDLVLGSGESGGTTILPDLRGMTLQEAENLILNNSFRIGNLFWDDTVISESDSAKARVYRQHPNPDYAFQANTGSDVDLWLTTDPDKLKQDDRGNREDSDFF